MSNFESQKKSKPAKKKAVAPAKNKAAATNKSDPALQTSKKPTSNKDIRWSYIQNDLTSMASEWTNLDTKPLAKSLEEEQLEKVKTMISNLKDKLNEF